MSAGFGSWLLGASALGGMLGMASSIFIVLAATTFGSALLYAISGFGFAVLAAPLFLLFLEIGDRLGAEALALLAIALLAVAGAYTLGAAALAFATA